ncbi:NTP transferase domain-containing protein [Candidatus Nomurabacteria bacterium]|nr:NTP transferase domain-containing protein [Candidatus Nomurabacteria bacterium]
MKGIILAGGAGTRLSPLTDVTSKQLLPVYDRPMVYYPLQTLIDAGVKEVLIISDPVNIGNFVRLLGSGSQFGIKIVYDIQNKPEGLAQAFLIGESFIGSDNVIMILGDNLFLGDSDIFSHSIASFDAGANIFVKEVTDPKRFGVAEFDQEQKVISIEEKPESPKSNFAVTGLYIYDNSVVAKAHSLKPSKRGELEITDLNNLYLKEKKLKVTVYQGEWLDMGTFDTLLKAANLAADLRKK